MTTSNKQLNFVHHIYRLLTVGAALPWSCQGTYEGRLRPPSTQHPATFATPPPCTRRSPIQAITSIPG